MKTLTAIRNIRNTTWARLTGSKAILLGACLGLRSVPLKPWDRYSHALAGTTLFLCGAAIQFLGL